MSKSSEEVLKRAEENLKTSEIDFLGGSGDQNDSTYHPTTKNVTTGQLEAFKHVLGTSLPVDFGKCNGLSSNTKFYEYMEGMHTIQYHEHPDTKELVIMDTWWIQDGEDDVSPEFEVVEVYPPVTCELTKMNVPYMENGRVKSQK